MTAINLHAAGKAGFDRANLGQAVVRQHLYIVECRACQCQRGSGINIDLSPTDQNHFPLTQFVPWAAYLHLADGTRQILEQDELLETLASMPADNPNQICFDESIEIMSRVPKVRIQL